MARIPAATRENVPQDQADEFDRMVESLGGVPPYGPGSVMIHVPKAHQAATALNQYLRNDSSLPEAALELSMLLAAREYDCQHIWNAHAASARAAGVQDAVVDAIRDGDELPPLSDLERAVINYAREFFEYRRVGRGRLPGRAGAVRQAGADRADPGHRQLQSAGLRHQRLRPRPAPQPHGTPPAGVNEFSLPPGEGQGEGVPSCA